MSKSFLTGTIVGVFVSVLLFGGVVSDAADQVDQTDQTDPTDQSDQSDLKIRTVADIEEDVDEEIVDEGTKIVYRTPDSCKEFTLYLDNLANTLNKKQLRLTREQTLLTEMKKEFEDLTQNYIDTELRIKKIVQYDPSNLKENPELAKMVKLYETFTPEEAAARLRNLDLDLTLAILKGMKSKNLSKVLSAMEPKLSAALSSRIVRGF